MTDRLRSRRAFTLLTVLWALAGASAIATAVALLARRVVAVAANQQAAMRAYWAAQECASLLRDAAEAVLRTAPQSIRDPQRAWRALNQSVGIVARHESLATCTAQLVSNGNQLDLNRATAGDLQRLFGAITGDPARSDSLAAAVLDWRDADAEPRPLGAERSWYASVGRSAPRDGPFGNERELAEVRGIADLPDDQRATLDSCVTVGDDLVDLWHAPRPVLQTLPGVSPPVADAIVALRSNSLGFMELLQLVPALPPFARDSLVAHYSELIARATTQPEHWLLIARGSSGQPEITTRIEVLLGLAGAHVGTIRRRYWVE